MLKVSPKRIISCKFGVALYPSKVYEAEQLPEQPTKVLVHVGGPVHVVVAKRNLKVVDL